MKGTEAAGWKIVSDDTAWHQLLDKFEFVSEEIL
jgi:hypothetical protein